MTDKPFEIQIGAFRRKDKASTLEQEEKLKTVSEKLGFVDRSPKKRRGRPASPRTGQVHARVLPHISDEISDEAKRRGVQQGVLIEEAWELYKANH